MARNITIHKPTSVAYLPDDALASVKRIAATAEIGVSTLWRYAATDPDFPKPIRLSARCTRFRVGDIRNYFAKKAGV